MTIYAVYIINRAGGLIYQYDHNTPRIEIEKTFSFPLDLVLKIYDEKVVVAFGQRDDIKVGHCVLSVNGCPVNMQTGSSGYGRQLEDGRNVMDILSSEENYPISIKFGRPRLTTNEKIMLAGMFHSLFAIASQMSPVPQSSGIQVLETEAFKLHCTQTLTGIKFFCISDPKQGGQQALLRQLYETYADYALKNPFYSIDMPIRCDLFDINLQAAVEQAEKLGITNV